jgi:organic hydroperoxide reductase OsmC/OhrA
VADASMLARAGEIHAEAAEKCFIAASVSFPVHHVPTAVVVG